MKTWAVYREAKYSRAREKRLDTIHAATIDEAVQKFLDSQPDGWRDEIVRKQRNAATVWRRRFTPTGLYKGETCFMLWPLN